VRIGHDRNTILTPLILHCSISGEGAPIVVEISGRFE
jgi:hypothetical protein